MSQPSNKPAPTRVRPKTKFPKDLPILYLGEAGLAFAALRRTLFGCLSLVGTHGAKSGKRE